MDSPRPTSSEKVKEGKEEQATSVMNGHVESGIHEARKPKSYSNRQKLVLLVCALANLGCGAIWSLQAPFYPNEAERKGIPSSVYGFVFGAFSLTEFIVAPIYGRYIGYIGTKFLINAGIFVTSSCCILFGFLAHAPPGIPFISLSFAIRIVEATGDAAFRLGTFTIIAREFPGNVGTTIAILRTCNGVGLISGPSLGGLFYEVGGFFLPFAVMGGFLSLIACIIFFIFMKNEDFEPRQSSGGTTIWHVMRIPSIQMAVFAVFIAAFCIGFIVPTLEPHLRQFNLTPAVNGAMFMISSGMYAATTVFWGKLADMNVHPKLLMSCASSLMCVAYLLLGPLPFFPMDTHLWLCAVALAFHGFGIGGEIVITNVDALREGVRQGLPDNTETYGVIGGVFAAFVQIGAFAGPSVGGVLLQAYGFRTASLFPFCAQLTVAAITMTYYLKQRSSPKKDKCLDERTSLINSETISEVNG